YGQRREQSQGIIQNKLLIH
ncbi:unnamed protein product, partial [Leptidea sinapis]